MGNRLLLAAIVALLIALSAGAWAQPSFFGYTGLLRVPTADVLAPRAFNLGFNTIDVAGDNQTNAFGNYGFPAGFEAGIDRIKNGDSDTLLNAKYQFRAETVARPAAAAGIIDATGEEQRTIYVVGSKSILGPPRLFAGEVTNLRLHVGLSAGGLDGVLAGASVTLGNRLTLIAEYDSDNWNAGGRLYLVSGLRAHVAWFDIGGEDDFGLGISFQHPFR